MKKLAVVLSCGVILFVSGCSWFSKDDGRTGKSCEINSDCVPAGATGETQYVCSSGKCESFELTPINEEEETAEEADDSTVLCTMEYTPVCGVDNKTYSNRCVAEKQNKVEVANDGECAK